MKKFKALYKGMYDDLKDAEMMIDYACEIKEHTPDDKMLADELAKYAKYRLEHFAEFHKLFVEHAMKEKTIDMKTVDHCMWGEAHEQMQEWHDKIEKKISKYK
jgi:hypothetical protein